MKKFISLIIMGLAISAWVAFYPQHNTAPAAVIPAGPLSAVPKEGISATVALPSAADAARALGVRRAVTLAEAQIHATDTEVSMTALPALALFNGRLAWMVTFNRGTHNLPPPGYPLVLAGRLVVVIDGLSGAAMQAYTSGPFTIIATAVPVTAPIPSLDGGGIYHTPTPPA